MTCSLSFRGVEASVLLVLSVLSWSGCGRSSSPSTATRGEDEFLKAMNVGRSLYQQGDAAKASESFAKAVGLSPFHTDARMNLANAFLLGGQADEAIQQATTVLAAEPNLAAAHYVVGCAHLRVGRFEDAVKSLQVTKDLDRTINAVSLQLGRAYQGLGRLEEALREFQEVIEFETNQVAPIFVSARYNASQVLVRLGRTDEANQALAEYQRVREKAGSVPSDVATFERCLYTEARVPFVLDQPAATGAKVTFSDATSTMLPEGSPAWQGPMAVMDINHRGTNDLFIRDGDASFRLLMNEGGVLRPRAEPFSVTPGIRYGQVLVGDLNNDRFEDVLVLGDKAVHAFRFATNGNAFDATIASGLRQAAGAVGAIADLDFTGKLDLWLVPSGSNAVRMLRNLGNMYFKDITATSGVPATVAAPAGVWIDDWNNDDLLDAIILRRDQPPLVLLKNRGGAILVTNVPTSWPVARALVSADLNNDMRSDWVVGSSNAVHVFSGGLTNHVVLPLGPWALEQVATLDFDNDGWMDLVAYGPGVRLWRNLGEAGFREVTAECGLERWAATRVDSVVAADFDNDCDTDLILSMAGQGLRVLRNDGGNAGQQIRLRPLGNRSNASGLGIKIELTGGRWRTLWTVHRLPVEIGVGHRRQLDAINVRWFDLALNQAEIDVQCQEVLGLPELVMPTGSCPYLYTWDGQSFRFVTDLLGAAPLGLPMAEGRYIAADPDEFVWLGDATKFPPREGEYWVQITEELREVLYLDEVKLMAVDHPPGMHVYPTDKLLPGPPFPSSDLVLLQQGRAPVRATRLDGTDVTAALRVADGSVVSPERLRVPQLRGLAEPHGIILEFGSLPTDRPLFLGLTGWLRFGGGMANIGGSHDPTLPFPFPVLEMRLPGGPWQRVDVQMGAPAGKTKRIMVDLTGKLAAGVEALRLSAAFEIHWDQAVLFEKAPDNLARRTWLAPTTSDLHWRGFSEFEERPWTQPLTPDYARVQSLPPWRARLEGWSTRYGSADALIAKRDDALALINAGDELTVRFSAASLPPLAPGQVRDFFLFTVGWDKDADFHVKRGHTVEPLPYQGMDDQAYGDTPRPERLSAADALMKRYNTRWVGPRTISRR